MPPEPVRHADHDPAVICRPALGHGLCEPAGRLTAVIHCHVCGDVPCDSAEEAERRARQHHDVTRHPVTVAVEAP